MRSQIEGSKTYEIALTWDWGIKAIRGGLKYGEAELVRNRCEEALANEEKWIVSLMKASGGE